MNAPLPNFLAQLDQINNAEFLAEVYQDLEPGTHGWVCSFRQDPSSKEPGKWGGRPYKGLPNQAALIDRAGLDNTYFCTSVLAATETGEIVRRKDAFVRLAALVADDMAANQVVGENVSWELMTSPGKFQVGILVDQKDPDCQDKALVDRVMAAMAESGRHNDTSGNASVRYARLPHGTNTKGEYGRHFKVQLLQWNPEIRYSLDDACTAFGIDLDALRHQPAEQQAVALTLTPTQAPQPGSTAEVNQRAMQNFEAWVPALFPQAAKRGDGYRISSQSLGRNLEEDIGIAREGIVDFGVHDQGDPRQGKRTPVELVAEHRFSHDWKQAADWLRPRLGMAPFQRPADKSEAVGQPEEAAQSESESEHWLEAVKGYKAPLHHWTQPPPIRWAVDGLIREGTVGALIAPGATGKTTLLITLGICHALGVAFMGRTVKQGGFLLLSLDDSQEDLDAAVGQVIRSMALSDEQVQAVAAFLRVISLQGKSGPRSFNLPGSPGAPNPEMHQALMEACLATPSPVGLCVDTLRQFAGGPTNAEEVIMQVSAICASVSTHTGAYVCIPHHTGKAGAREDQGDMYAGSGSAAIADNARFVLVLETVRERSDLARLTADVQQEQNAGLCDVLRLTSRRGSIRHKAAPDLYIVRRGFSLQMATTQEAGSDARTLQILAAISAEVEAGRKPSKNSLFKVLGGNRNKVFAELDELIECGLVAGISVGKSAAEVEGGIGIGINKTMASGGLTAAGASFLSARKAL
jgi:AAA domain